MARLVTKFKALFLVVAIIAAFSVAPAFAWGTPYLTDTGSSYWTVRVNGYNFSNGGWVFVESVDRSTGVVSSSGWVTASSANCFIGYFFCIGGGSFSYYGAPNTQCGAGRDVWAYDWGTAANGAGWVGPLTVGCA